MSNGGCLKKLPKPREVIIIEISVALNPVDWKAKDFTEGIPLGFEGAGDIEAVGEGVVTKIYFPTQPKSCLIYALCPTEIVVKHHGTVGAPCLQDKVFSSLVALEALSDNTPLLRFTTPNSSSHSVQRTSSTATLPQSPSPSSSKETQQLGYDLLQQGRCLATVHPPSIKETTSGKKVVSIFGSLPLPGNRKLGRTLAKHLPGLIEAGELS
ncbi:hypothetical protein V8E55_009303 [Tylopilus felleus]